MLMEICGAASLSVGSFPAVVTGLTTWKAPHKKFWEPVDFPISKWPGSAPQFTASQGRGKQSDWLAPAALVNGGVACPSYARTPQAPGMGLLGGTEGEVGLTYRF